MKVQRGLPHNDGCLEIMDLQKSNQSLGGDDYFFAFCISLPRRYPAPQQNAARANNASYDIVIISNLPFQEIF